MVKRLTRADAGGQLADAVRQRALLRPERSKPRWVEGLQGAGEVNDDGLWIGAQLGAVGKLEAAYGLRPVTGHPSHFGDQTPAGRESW